MTDAPRFITFRTLRCTLSILVIMSTPKALRTEPIMIIPSDLIGSTEVCEILSIDRATVVRRVNRGTLPYLTKLAGANGALVFDRNDIAALVGAA